MSVVTAISVKTDYSSHQRALVRYAARLDALEASLDQLRRLLAADHIPDHVARKRALDLVDRSIGGAQ